MTSQSLAELYVGLSEVHALRSHPPRGRPNSKWSLGTRQASVAHRRACTVLLCSHFERYIYSINEQAIEYLNSCRLSSREIPVKIRLLQTKSIVDLVAKRQWDLREENLTTLFMDHGPLWLENAAITTLEPSANLEWMKSPKVKDVIRFYALYGVGNIFEAVTRTTAGRQRLSRELGSLVDIRNGIAHGDQTVQPVRSEITQYSNAVKDFCTRADRCLGRQLSSLSGHAEPW